MRLLLLLSFVLTSKLYDFCSNHTLENKKYIKNEKKKAHTSIQTM